MQDIKIDLSNFKGKLTDKQKERLQTSISKSIVGLIYNEARILASKELKTSRNAYLRGLRINKSGKEWEVEVVGSFAEAIEKGKGAYDLKPGLLNGKNAKKSRKGTKYNVVPIRMTVGKGKNQISSSMRNAIKKGDTKKVDLLIKKGGNKFAKGASFVTKDKDGKSLKTGRVIKFLTVSENSPKDSWIHPGFKAKNFLERAGKIVASSPSYTRDIQASAIKSIEIIQRKRKSRKRKKVSFFKRIMNWFK